MTFKTLLKSLCLLTAISVSTAQAKQDIIGAWEVQCKESCIIGQGVANGNNGGSKFGITISQIKSSNLPVAQINTPLGLYIPQGLGLEIGEFKQAIPFITCLPNGCKSIIELNEKIVSQLYKQSKLNLRFYTADSKQKQISFSLNGFKKAYAHIIKG